MALPITDMRYKLCWEVPITSAHQHILEDAQKVPYLLARASSSGLKALVWARNSAERSFEHFFFAILSWLPDDYRINGARHDPAPRGRFSKERSRPGSSWPRGRGRPRGTWWCAERNGAGKTASENNNDEQDQAGSSRPRGGRALGMWYAERSRARKKALEKRQVWTGLQFSPKIIKKMRVAYTFSSIALGENLVNHTTFYAEHFTVLYEA